MTTSILKKIKSVDSALQLKEAGKKYKKFIKTKNKVDHKQLSNKLRTLKSNNAKEFWDILGCNEKSKSATNNIPLQNFAEHFRELGNKQADANNSTDFDPILIDRSANDELNVNFTTKEIADVIKKLKNNKACGIDMIRNEFIKNCSKDMIEVITNLFNLILDSGVIPTNWCLGIIIPLYKNKGSVNDPDNYRGITLLSCLSKLFTSALNNRITIFLERFDSIGEEQAGFRAGYSTMDHVFVLNSIIDIYLQKRKRVYCAFIDYKKAFDLVDRSSLWSKLISHGINGKLMSVIFNLYHHAKSCVRANGKMSDYFTCNVGVRQGENLSPLLFAIYLNDFESYVSRHYKGLDTLSDDITYHLSDPDIEIFLRLHVLSIVYLFFRDSTK